MIGSTYSSFWLSSAKEVSKLSSELILVRLITKPEGIKEGTVLLTTTQ